MPELAKYQDAIARLREFLTPFSASGRVPESPLLVVQQTTAEIRRLQALINPDIIAASVIDGLNELFRQEVPLEKEPNENCAMCGGRGWTAWKTSGGARQAVDGSDGSFTVCSCCADEDVGKFAPTS